MKIQFLFLSILFSIVMMTGTAVSTNADQPAYQYDQFIIENIWATPEKAGGDSILRFRIINEGNNSTRLVGIETSVSKEAKLMAKSDNRKPVIYNSIRIQENSDIDFTTHHLWVELGPLSRAIKAGEIFPLELILINNRLYVEVHVHDNQG